MWSPRWALRLALVKAARNDHEEWATQGVGIDLVGIHFCDFSGGIGDPT